MPLADYLSLKLFYFQTGSIIPLVDNISLYSILILVGILIIDQFLGIDKLNQIINLILFPIIVIATFYLSSYLSLILAFVNENPTWISLWLSFIEVWPIILIFHLCFSLILYIISLVKINNFINSGFIAPIIEEIAYRFFLINSLYLNGIGLFNAVFLSGLLFGIVHIRQVKWGKWLGGSAVNYAFIFGMFMGFISLYTGLITTILMHSASNIYNDLFRRNT